MCRESVASLLRHRMSAKIVAHCAMVLLLGWGTGVLSAQTINAPAPPLAQDNAASVPVPISGPQIRDISAYAVYYSNGQPNNGGGFQVGSGNLPSDVGLGGSIELGWTKFTDQSTFSLTYAPSFTARLRYSSLDAINQAFSLNTSRRLAPAWNFGFSVAGNYATIEESLFSPTALSNVASVPSTANDLTAALLAGKFTSNPQLGVVLTNSPLVESPVANLIYGQKVFTSSAQVNLSYLYARRLSVTFSGGGSYAQTVSGDQASTANTPAVIPNTTMGTATVALSYTLSPVSQLGATVTTNRVSSSLQDVYTTNSMATLGHTLGRQWIIQLHGGVGVTSPVRTSVAAATQSHPVAGGSLVYKTSSDTFLCSIDRTASDSYGLGASTSSAASASWRWRRPGSLWSLESSFSWQQLQGNFTNTSGWRATAGLNRAFGLHLILLWQYTYLNYSGVLQTSAYSLSESAVRTSIVWTPQANPLR